MASQSSALVHSMLEVQEANNGGEQKLVESCTRFIEYAKTQVVVSLAYLNYHDNNVPRDTDRQPVGGY
jgi:hypothetical protein